VDIRDAFFGELYNIASKDKSVIVLTADMGVNEFTRFHELKGQFYNVGISEQNMVSMAAGLALSGKKVYIYTIAAFLQRAFEQIKIDICQMNLPVIMIGGCVGFSNATDGFTHHCINDITCFRTLPNLTIYNPSNAESAKLCIRNSYKSKYPIYIRLDKGDFPLIHYQYIFQHDIVIIATGNMVHLAREFGSLMYGMDIGVIDILEYPFNSETLRVFLKRTRLIITLEEHLNTGLGSIISEFLTDNNMNIPLKRIGVTNERVVGSREYIQKHFGLDDIKDRVLEYLSVMKLKKEKGEANDIYRAPILCFVGLVGTGKTTIAYSIAEALGRPIARIPFGGMGDPLDLRGQSRMHPEAEPGKVIKALRVTQSKSPVILLDEIDRVTDQGRSSIMGVLVELLDPRQNYAFVDHYIDFPFDLSETLFITTANNTTNIATAVMDRLEPISMPSYTDTEKVTIGQKYILPEAMKASGLPAESLIIDPDVWANIVRPLGYDAGIRTLERNIDGVVRKVARILVEGKSQSVHVTSQNVKEFLPQ